MYYDTNKATMTNKCTSSAGRFAGHGGAPVQYKARFTQCSISRATPEATGRRHRATTCSILPQQPPGQQAIKQQSTNTPTKLAVLMAMAIPRYITACIAQWSRSRASLEATGHRHRASIMSDNINWTWLRCFFLCFHRQNCRKRSRVDAKNCMTYQTKEKGLIKVSVQFVGGSI
jgi:hypothetical protein